MNICVGACEVEVVTAEDAAGTSTCFGGGSVSDVSEAVWELI